MILSLIHIWEEYKKVLVTGGNGFLSCHLIEKILKNRKTSIVVLVREKSNEKAAAKFKRAMDWYFEKEDILKNYSGRLKILSGDVSVDKLGLDDDVYSDCLLYTSSTTEQLPCLL